MSTPPGGAPARDWWARPRVMLPVFAALLGLVILLTPQQDDSRLGDARLSAHLAGSLGARGLADVAARLGWTVRLRDNAAVPGMAPGGTVHAVLSPAIPLTPAQAHRYLEAVRAGDGLLLSLSPGHDALGDSLGLRHSRDGGVLVAGPADTAGCMARARDFVPPLWPDGRVHLFSLRWVRGRPRDAVSMARLRVGRYDDADPTEEAAAGFALGRGRVVAVADPDLLRNDVLRRCAWGADVMAVRALEWLRARGDSARVTLEFDEFHQGYGPGASTTSVTRRFLEGHPVGRAILQVLFAALVLLLAVAPRAIVPQPRPRAERRDPLEQADALAHAYEQVRATRTATRRLLRGVRSRTEVAGRRTRHGDDDEFLAAALAADPARRADVTLVQQALRPGGGTAPLPDIGAALRRIEDSLITTTSYRA